ncbi:MAG: anti-sigma factor [Rhizobiales bacterium]|nr:anti-sigma factor [Hyphomicrobiales bacterium]
MTDDEDHIALAAEYVLGTLDAAERVQVEAMMAVDADFRARVEAWDQKFAVLNQMVGSVEPRDEVWEKIRAAIGLAESRQPSVLPETESAPPVTPAETSATVAAEKSAEAGNVVAFSQDARRWRSVARVASALAAALVVLFGIQLAQPDWLPEGLRSKPRVKIVQVQAPATPSHAQYVAVLQKAGGGPAFILTVDAATRDFTVRKVDAAPEQGKSYELWLISDKLGAPRSLGVIGDSDFTARPVLASYDPGVVKDATYAVTIEPQGGSPTGKPTSTPVYTGKLIETVPSPSR